MHLQIRVFDVERQRESFALDRARQRRRNVEIERIAELVSLGGPAGLNAGGKIARIVASKAGFAQRSQKITQRFEAEEVEALVGNLELGLLRFAGLAADARLARWVVRLVDGDVVLLLHALNELFDEFVELSVGLHLLDLLAQVLVEHL